MASGGFYRRWGADVALTVEVVEEVDKLHPLRVSELADGDHVLKIKEKVDVETGASHQAILTRKADGSPDFCLFEVDQDKVSMPSLRLLPPERKTQPLCADTELFSSF